MNSENQKSQTSKREPAVIPTLADVALLANVSTATVSRCINTPDRVNTGTRERVDAAIKQLGYAPNFGAQALAAKRTNTIGAVIPTMDNAIFARGLQAFQEELHQSGRTLLVASSQYRPAREAEQIHALVSRGADALLLIGYQRDPSVYQFLEARGIPVLVAWAYDATEDQPSIGFDNRSAMRNLAESVIDLGHRDIATISAPQDENDRARERVLGIRDAMANRGLDPENLTLLETNYSIESGAMMCQRLLQSGKNHSVIMCGNDVLAVGAMRAARELGIDVPTEISITGFDDIELARVTQPALTTVHVPHRQMGREAAKMLVEMVAGTHDQHSKELQTILCLRETLARPASG